MQRQGPEPNREVETKKHQAALHDKIKDVLTRQGMSDLGFLENLWKQ